MLRRRPFFPRASAAFVTDEGRGCAPQESDDTEVIPPVSPRTRRESAHRNPWRAMLRRRPFFPRASAAFVTDGGGAAPRESRTTRRSSLQYHNEHGAEAPIETPWRAMLRRRPFFPRQRGFRDGWGAGLRPRESRTTRRSSLQSHQTRRGSAYRNPWMPR